MMQPWEIIKQLESDNSRKFKESVLTAVLLQAPHDAEFWEGCKFALDPMITFGVKAVPIKTGADGAGLVFETFAIALTGLVGRSVTGNAVQELFEKMMEHSTKDQWNNWYRRILIKDLRCGVTETTINKVRPGTVALFQCQLAKDAADHETKLRGEKILDYKLDGVRVIAVIQNVSRSMTMKPRPLPHRDRLVSLFSRNGKLFDNFPHIVDQLSKAATNIEGDWMLDGEITSQSFQELMTQVHRKSDANASDAVFNVFDAIPLHHFNAKFDPRTQIERSRALKDLFRHFADCKNVKRLEYTKVNLNDEIGQHTLDDMRDEAARLGLEGVMVKDADAPYECKRTSAWLKIKPNITVDLEVIDTEAGTGRNDGRLGALVCEGTDNGKRIRVNVGSGLSDAQRGSFWDSRDVLVGQTVEVKADAVTQNQDGTYSLRFPRFLRFRGFEAGEKL